MEKICLSQRRIDEIKNVCRKYGNDPGELINILHGVQDTLGYLPKEVQELIALELGISAARVYGVVSFYSFFTMKPKGKYPISVCMGTACYVRGGEKVLDEFRRQLEMCIRDRSCPRSGFRWTNAASPPEPKRSSQHSSKNWPPVASGAS